MKKLLIFLALCTFTAAMVPRERRSQNISSSKEETKTHEVLEKVKCMPQTPCAWAIFKHPSPKVIDFIKNNYCECPSGTTCEENETDESAYIHRCLPDNKN